MRKEVFMAGTGGQGVLLIGQILTQAALEEGLEVSWFPIYSPEVRGGSTTCTVIIADGRVGSPISGQPGVVMLMDQVAAKAQAAKARPGGMLLINSSLVKQVDRDDVKIIGIPASERAAELGEERVANMIMLGGYVQLAEVLRPETMAAAIKHVLPERHHRFLPLNTQALEVGAEWVRRQM